MRSGNRGQVIIVFVLSLLVLLGFAALAIDVGYMYSVRNDLQRSADAGALAGAYVFNDDAWLSGLIPPTLQNKAVTRAQDLATRDPVGAAPLPAGAVTVTFPAINQIRVDVQDTVNLFFAGVIGSPTVTLTATATAEAVQVGQNVECLKPLAVPLPPGTLSQGTRLSNLEIGRVGGSSINAQWVRDNSGHLFALDMCTSGGVGDTMYQSWISSPCTATCGGGSPFVADIGGRVRLRNSQSSTPTQRELNALIGLDGGASFNFDPVNYPNLPGSNAYRDDRWINSPRVTRVVLYDPSVVADPARQTDTSIPVWGFAGFWIDRVYSSNCNCRWVGSGRRRRWRCDTCWYVDGYFIPNSAVGEASPPPPPIGPSMKIIRLVQ